MGRREEFSRLKRVAGRRGGKRGHRYVQWPKAQTKLTLSALDGVVRSVSRDVRVYSILAHHLLVFRLTLTIV